MVRRLVVFLACLAALALASNAHAQTFSNPTWQGNKIDRCLHWGTDCDQPAADYFCQQKGYTGALDFKTARMRPTFILGDGRACDAEQCDGFTEIRCVPQPPPQGTRQSDTPRRQTVGSSDQAVQTTPADRVQKIITYCDELAASLVAIALMDDAAGKNWDVTEELDNSPATELCKEYAWSKEARQRRMLAQCDELAARYKLLILMDDSPHGPGGVPLDQNRDDMQDLIAASIAFGSCREAGWTGEGFGARNPGQSLSVSASQPPPPQRGGQPWSWAGGGLCKTEYVGHTLNGKYYAPAAPVETRERLSATWSERLGLYQVNYGCGRTYGRERDFSFSDQRDQSKGDSPVSGCYYKCRSDYRVSNGQVSFDVDRATFSADVEDSRSARWSNFKGHVSCTFIKQ